ncbi:Uncharacterized conserved protein YndB, AHSA1/START domain [Rubritalea squalenifaciens DSM 18772]|uniref:Uncharacterized conserved protein YndB, AHSA1/START domain n=1 Tax=Rubritalea squalenifaciens DSM 18772 TaxID=1123071 RepID=A0A1M6GP42_9BACT|nr:SRPBCC domain-containing protein [Rubritalea squalenifaciens]SHJ11626.1 Uncharacterized conserved protein YndB, AHSA1/START domain [Rubritalea squalenifaciens DSM 18772]
MKTDCKKIVTLPLPLDQAMQLLVESATVATWFGADRAEVEPEKGGRYEIFWQTDGEYDSTGECRIESIDENSLVIQWRGPDKHAHFAGLEKPGSSKVSFHLECDGEVTVLIITHSGLSESPDAEKAIAYYNERWKIWGHNLELVGTIRAKLISAQEIAKKIIRDKDVSIEDLDFVPKPAGGLRKRFDFSDISLNTGELFGDPTVMKNVVDQA